jgi:TetR/AcrR family transcriptional repressor of nem operon
MAGRPRNFDEAEVLAQAMQAFWAHGYEGTGVAELERATGLLRQSLYGAFGDKRQLFMRAVDYYCDHVIKPGLLDVLDAPGSARANVERVLERWQSLALTPEFQGCLVGNTATELPKDDPELRELLRRKLQLMEEAFVRALTRAKKQGEVPETLDPRATARTLLSLSQGLSILARVRGEPAFVRSVIASARALLG